MSPGPSSSSADADVEVSEADPGVLPGRPRLRLTDVVAAVRATRVADVEAVAAQLMAYYDVEADEEALRVILVCMHASRQDVIRDLRSEAVHWRMLGANASVILEQAFQYLDRVADDQFGF